MGLPGAWELLIILVIVALVFGTNRLRNLGSDVGSIIKGYRDEMKGQKDGAEDSEEKPSAVNTEAIADNPESDGK